MSTEQQREYARNYRRKYYQEHKEEIKEYTKAHPEYQKPYTPRPTPHKTREKQYENPAAWREAHRAETRENAKRYAQEHPEYLPAWKKEQRRTNPRYRLIENLRSNLSKALNGGKAGHTFDLLGYTKDDLVTHMINLLESVNYICPGCGEFDMHNGFDIDHATPLCTADLDEEIIALFALTNLQPLCHQCNITKNCSEIYYY